MSDIYYIDKICFEDRYKYFNCVVKSVEYKLIQSSGYWINNPDFVVWFWVLAYS